jgi:hypothetical protein
VVTEDEIDQMAAMTRQALDDVVQELNLLP